MTGPYGLAAAVYTRKGWRAIPVDTQEPGMVPRGVTGYKGEDPNAAQREGFLERWSEANIGVVLPPDLIMLDVDHGKKDGKDGVPTFARIALDGPEVFQATYTNGHGEMGPYRHFLYRVPDDVTPEDIASLAPGHDGIDVLRWMHRWARVSPSVHSSGEVYEWRDPEGNVCKAPDVNSPLIPQLTRAQWDHLVFIVGSSSKSRYDVTSVDVEEWLALHGGPGRASQTVRDAVSAHWGRAEGSVGVERHGSHHSAMAACLQSLAHLGEEGEEVQSAIEWLRARFLEYREDEGEFERALVGAIEQAVAKTASGDRGGTVLLGPDGEPLRINRPKARKAGLQPDDPGYNPYEVKVNVHTNSFAREYLRRHHTEAPLFFQRRSFWVWDERAHHYREMDDEALDAEIAANLDGASEIDEDGEISEIAVKETTAPRVTKALKQVAYRRPVDRTTQRWPNDLLPGWNGVPFLDGWLDVSTGELTELGPERDIRWNTGITFTGASHTVKRWLVFLAEIGLTADQIRQLQQWFGYLLSGGTEYHKMLLLLGPPRSGKGTIEKILMAMFGAGGTGADVSMFENDHGPSALLGKTVAFFDDVRLDRVEAKVRRALLTISSFGPTQINPKHKDLFSVELPTRLVMCTNNTPTFSHESTTALADRFHVIKTGVSFAGREDPCLLDRLLEELPGIVMWGLDGLRDLRENGWAVAESSTEIVAEMALASSPVRQFVEDMVEFGSEYKVTGDDLYRAYDMWCRANGVSFPGTKQKFSSDLKDAYGDIVQSARLKQSGRVIRGWRGCRLSV